VSEYYPELFERRKRSSRDHEEWGKIKSMILLELMKGPETRSGLKLKINEQLKKEGNLPISIKTIVRHLRDSDKKGLIDRKIVRERKGLLELPLSNPEEIAKFIDELSKNKTIGLKVSYFVDRAFAEAFLSPFGDRFSNYNRIHKVVDIGINNIYLNPELKQYEEDVRAILVAVLHVRIEYMGNGDVSFIFHARNTFVPDLHDGIIPPDVDLLAKIDPPGPIPFYLDVGFAAELDYETIKKVIEFADKSDLLSIIIRASKEIRGEIDTFFKVCYILNVLDNVNLFHRAKVNSSIKGLINILDLTMFHVPNWEIEKINPKSEILEEFKELLFKAINGSFYEDRSFNYEYTILNLNKEGIALSSKETSLGWEISEALYNPFFVDKTTSNLKKNVKLLEEREKNGLLNTFFKFY